MSVKNFVKQWTGRGYEKGEAQSFWLSLLRDVFGIAEPEKLISFEVPVPQGFIDGLILDTKILIEQKSSNVKLDDEVFLQAKKYNDALEWSRKARWIVTCNFNEFFIYDMDKRKPQNNPRKLSLQELPEKFHALEMLIDKDKTRIIDELKLSLAAGEIVAKIYDALLTQYINPNAAESLASLNKLCVRLVFCLYAESSGLFGKHKIFREYLSREYNLRRALIDLFDTLNTPLDARDPYLDDTLKKFPYVNGGLFDGAIEIPNFTPQIKELLLEEASSGFNWSGISPTIFGAVFESTLNPETRRTGGMHYTSIENIHKVIDPLFLDDLREEFSQLKTKKQLRAFHDKIAAIKIFDPACGSGNFLTESYLSLRRLENDLLKKLLGSQITLGELDDPIKVSIKNFYGIEINDFAVAVAQTALWIAELQMIQETREIIHRDLDFLPLKSYANICRANALLVGWHDLAPEVNYIIGNPPFVGHQWRTPAQVEDMTLTFADYKKHGKLDYVAAWYKKAADFIRGTKISCALLSTNSIVQGESVRVLWEYLFAKGVVINFAQRPFKWSSESSDIAAVTCVVIGFANFHAPIKKIFDGKNVIVAQNINGYLLDAPNIFIKNRGNPPPGFPKMTQGNTPVDDGNLLLTPAERDELIAKNPLAEKYILPYIGAREFINGIERYCLYLVDCPPNELRRMPLVMKRLEKVREFRLTSKTASVRRAAETPALFYQIRQPMTNFLCIPRVSSERRRYIPIGFMPPNVIVSDAALMISDATLYLFGMLTSSIHMAWTRVVAGRLRMDIRYSPSVYYNFPFVEVSDKQKVLIEATAQKILDVRKKYPEATLADLYDELTMPADLREAHRANDRAVAQIYGFEKILDNEPAIVSELLKLYETLTKA